MSTRRTIRSRRVTTPVPPAPGQELPKDVLQLQEQLRLSRAQAAYLHRQLDLARQQQGITPTNGASLAEENADLRWRLNRLEAHYTELERRAQVAEMNHRMTLKDFEELLHARGKNGTWIGQTSMSQPATLDQALLKLLVVAHPDKWSAGQGALPLAEEVTKLVNALRERGEVRL